MSEVDLPLTAVRAQVASAIDLVVCCSRLLDGSRRITHVAEVLPLDEKGDYRVQDLYLHTIIGRSPDGSIMGAFASTAVEPMFAPRLKAIEALGEPPAHPQPFAHLFAQAEEPPVKQPAPQPRPAQEKPRPFVKPQPHMQATSPASRPGGPTARDADPAEVLALVDQPEEIEPEPPLHPSPERTAVTRKPQPPRKP
jgi:pilus assembly protein CpaF